MAESGDAGKKTMLVAFDDSEHSKYALQWTLDQFFTGGNVYKLVILHAATSPSSIISLGGPAAGSAAVLPKIESELWKISNQVIEKARELCFNNWENDVAYEVIQGDARQVLCEAVEKFNADVLVLGSHGYGAVKRVVLGSVSDYCAHHAKCTVMIVKKPKNKH